MHNYYTYLYNKAVFDLLKEVKGEGEAILFARSATAGGQKDNAITRECTAEFLTDSVAEVKAYAKELRQIRIEKEVRCGREFFENYDIGELTSRTFGMFGGKEKTICLEAHNRLVGVVLDRFGRDIMIHRKDPEHFKTLVRVNVSDQFFGWIASLGPDAVIASPDEVRDKYREFLEKSLSNYK